MFKDYDKYLSTSLKVYLFVLIIIFILKLIGLDYFGIDIDNPTIIRITNILNNNWVLRDVIYFIPLLFNQYVILSITCNDNSKKIFVYNIMLIPIFYFFEIYKLKLFGEFSFFIEILYFYIVCLIYKRKIKLKKFIKIVLLILLFQLISIFTRYRYSIEYVTNIIASFILNLDYMIMLIIVYKLNFMKGEIKECYQDHQYSSLQKQIHLKNLHQKLQKKLQNKKQKEEQSRTEKIAYRIYFTLYILWNLFTLICILFIALLNNTIIECIFIVFSFLITKSVFGKPFHLKGMIHCFIISNLSYYVLNRLTTPIGISIVVPILLGVGLSYVTSKFVKKTYKPLYRGMSEELFEETILKVEDKDSMKYKICYDFYIKKKSIISLAMKYNYTESGIRKIKDRVNDKIKRLN